ncbi:hypothetical protein P8936_09365 [Edaphobacter paludis]|uniref:Uncharacterized protein n=1 Tax=Edaphobacter paludis TaxID=3035702 RepID=A0AAU7D3K4_9BACT
MIDMMAPVSFLDQADALGHSQLYGAKLWCILLSGSSGNSTLRKRASP